MNLAPNGKPSNLTDEQYKLVRTPAFKNWFGDWENDAENSSKVVDENGEPLVVYHGSSKKFNVFDIKQIGQGTGNEGHYGYGFYFSDNIKEAKGYGEKILECYLKIKKPFKGTDNEFDLLKKEGFSGIDNKVPINIDFKDLQKKIKSIDSNAYKFMQIAKEKGIDNVWSAYLNSNPNESKIDLNDLYEILTYTDLFNQNNSVPSYVLDELKSFEIEPKLKYGYENSQSLHWVTDLGNNSKPFTNFIKSLNYDGVIYGSEYVTFYAEQIKLADGTNTTFDANNNDIRYKEGGNLTDELSLVLKGVTNENKYKGNYKKIFDIIEKEIVFYNPYGTEKEELVGDTFYITITPRPENNIIEKISKLKNVEVINQKFKTGGTTKAFNYSIGGL